MDKDTLFIDKSNGMLCYKVSAEDKNMAEAEYNNRFPASNMVNTKTVYNRKESRLAGILGEIVFQKLYPLAKKSTDMTYDFDYKSIKMDVKCKYRTVKPLPEFEASFFLYQTSDNFNANAYYFMSTMPDFKYVWLCGFDTKENILSNPHMEIWRKGQTDTNNGMTFREDTVCLKYKYLRSIEMDM